MTPTVVIVDDAVAKRNYGTGTLYAGKDGYWYARFHTVDGRRAHRKLGKAKPPHRDGISKKTAEEKLRELIMADNAGDAVTTATTVPTLAELGEVALAQLQRNGKKKSHIETFRGHLRKHINPAPLGTTLITDVTDKDVARLVARLQAAGAAPKTIHNVHGTLHSVLERARRDLLIERNPAHLAELPRIRKSKRLMFLTEEEVERVLAAAPPDEDAAIAEHFPVGQKYGGPDAVRAWWPVVRLLILTAARTGMRLGELRGLRWEDLDWMALKVRVRENYVRGVFDDPKSVLGSRGIPLTRQLISELEAHHRSTVWNLDHHLVLAHPHTGRPLDRVRLGYHYQAALKRADVRPVRIHDLRHTFGTTVAASGKVSMRTLQEWMGHEDIRTTQIYAHYFPGEDEAEVLDEIFAPKQSRPAPQPIDEVPDA